MQEKTFGELIRSNLQYYVKVPQDGIIKEGAMQAWCGGELMPIKNTDDNTIGDTPASFSDERSFYNPV